MTSSRLRPDTRASLRAVRADLGQLQKQVLGAVEQPGLEIVLAELEQRLRALVLVERGTRDQVLVDADGALDLAAAAEQVPERKVGLDRIRIDLEHADKNLDGLVRLLVEQEIKALELGRWQVQLLGGVAPVLEARRQPARGGRQRQQQP